MKSAVAESVTPSAEHFKKTTGTADFDRWNRWTSGSRGENNRNT